jgi:adhesin/invasin
LTNSTVTRTNRSHLRRLVSCALATLLGLASATCGSGGDGGSGPKPVPADMAIEAGEGQTATVHQAVPIDPAVMVTDADGRPVSGVAVTFGIKTGGGSVTGPNQITNGQGIATLQAWVLGTGAGAQALTATVTGLTAVDFSATASADVAANVTEVAGNHQVSHAGISLSIKPKVRVTDQFGNALANANVHFEVASGGGSVTGADVPTDPTGSAEVGDWQLGIGPGDQTLSATVAGVTPFVFVATATANAPVSMTILAGDNQSVPSGTQVPIAPAVIFKDQFDNPVPGELANVAQYDGDLPVSQFTSDAAGIARILNWTPGGLGTNTLTVVNPCCPQVQFTATTLLGPPSVIQVVAGPAQSAPVLQSLPVNPVFQVTDAGFNPIAGAVVTFATDPAGGTLAATSDTSDANGQVTPGAWTMGTVAGAHLLTVTVSVTLSGTLGATTTAGTPAHIAINAGDNQTSVAGTPLPIRPRVLVTDQFGNPVDATPVTFAVTGGGGNVTGATPLTDAAGTAAVGSWTLGSVPGPNTLKASAGAGHNTTFTATGTGGPSQIVIVAGNNQTSLAGAPVPVVPTVQIKDAQGTPVPGVEVGFSIAIGNGSVDAALDTTDANGMADPGSWTLGRGTGTQTLDAFLPNVSVVTFAATAIIGPPASMSIIAGDSQTQLVNSAVSIFPAVLVKDAAGNGVSDIPVQFTVTAGGGSVFGLVPETDGLGIVRANWTLGSQPGLNTMSATESVSGLHVSFSATALVSAYQIDVRAVSALTPSQQLAFDSAKARLQRLIVSDEPDIPLNVAAGTCFANQPAMNETVDDIVIFAEVGPIDGPGNIVGQAGPCLIRTGSFHTVVGVMRFDIADLNNIEAAGLLQTVILHEMQHVLGFGSMWQQRGVLSGAGTGDPCFTGSNAMTAFNSIGGQNSPGNTVPVEKSGGLGTADSHWRESVFGAELMTGFVNAGFNPLSMVTVTSFQDLGYQVNTSAADAFSVGPFPAPGRVPSGRVFLGNDAWTGPLFEVGVSGALRPVRRN